ncbi:Polyketide synthase modules and related proteins [Azospirillum argentinense]|uniref:amino acid adenylation domain-containing protein n=1 Tax=Azospirillum argentinense TaxID=2970906 RepID=UPI0032DE2CBC
MNKILIDRHGDMDVEMSRLLEDELAVAAGSTTGAPAWMETRLDASPPASPPAPVPPATAGDGGDVAQRFLANVAGIASRVLKIPPERLNIRENMARYGVDSIIVTEIMRCISDQLDLPIAPTVFFEARTLEELATILHQRYRKAVERSIAAPPPEPPPAKTLAETLAKTPAGPSADSGEADAEVAGWIDRYRSLMSGAPAAMDAAAGEAPPAVPAGASAPADEPVAIIAMDGLFPQSPDLKAFENALRDGRDCITEVPPDRWDWREVFGDPKLGEFTKVRYGGFAPDIDKFDPLFFGISPREAEMMDPQHRLFIQCVWRLIESAGYAPRSLSGRKVGLFIGINLQDYALLIDRAGAIEALHLTSLGHMFCPNRLSFLLDLHGPSQVIDTACSSSLVALHRAVLAVRHEGCEMAIAGGANLQITPDMHIMYSKTGMICEDGRCKTFSPQANGYARADGVGAVLLKPLSRAERDGDPILAVIRGSAENHGGTATSLTAPNPKAQAALIVEAHGRAGIDPRSVGFVECHGTGTALGDPIEINGLKLAFETLYDSAGLPRPPAPHCGLGSVKSNIGHAETAAGIAGVIKAVLSIRNRRLYPTLHCAEVNPLIDLTDSPFFILREGRPWQRAIIDGREQPLRAGVSSFGAGGSNAHVVIEEYRGSPAPAAAAPDRSALVVLSARTAEQLDRQVDDLRRFLDETPASDLPALADIAYTLHIGRDAFAERLAVVADSVADLRATLDRFRRDGAAPGCRRGSLSRKDASRLPGDDPAIQDTLLQAWRSGDLAQLAALWTSGAPVDWPGLHAAAPQPGRRPRRVPLPTYPFARQRCWLTTAGSSPGGRRGAVTAPALHPLLHVNSSTLAEPRFTARFSGREFFLADHVVMGAKLLPGAAYLEMARAALDLAAPPGDGDAPLPLRIRNAVWARPYVAGDRPAALHIGLRPDPSGQIPYQIYSEDPAGQRVPHAQGIVARAGAGPATAPAPLDVGSLRAAITAGRPEDRQRMDGPACYAAFRAMGIDYGPAHRGLQSVVFSPPGSPPQVLARIALPDSLAAGADAYGLHPALMDAALQACIGLVAASGTLGSAAPKASLPFALDELVVLAPLPRALWVWIRPSAGGAPGKALTKIDIDIADDQGRICAVLRGFTARSPDAETKAAKADGGGNLLLCRPVWTDQPAPAAGSPQGWSRHRVVVCARDDRFPASLDHGIARHMPGASVIRPDAAGPMADAFRTAALAVFEAVRQAGGIKDGGRTLVQVVVPADGDGALFAGLSGLLLAAHREMPGVFGQLVAVDRAAAQAGLAARLATDAVQPSETRIRHQDGVRRVLLWKEQVWKEGPDPAPAAGGPPWKDDGVYLITGGAGGLGLLFARRIARATRNAQVVLCGRSAAGTAQDAALDALRAEGLRVTYRQVDVTRPEQVDAAVADILATAGRIDGILHCAGLLRDGLIHRKTVADFDAVLAPKVAGTLNLDRATAALDLDVFILFSSAAAVLGSAGQADYAAANAFLDAFAHHRNGLAARGERRGHTLSIDWPLWADGGMRMEPAALALMVQTTGTAVLPEDRGVEAFERILASGDAQGMVLFGDAARLRPLLAARPQAVAAGTGDVIDHLQADGDLRAGIGQALVRMVADLMKFDLTDVDADGEWGDYGFDSITLTDFANRLNQRFSLELTPTVFFEHGTIAAFAAWLAREHARPVAGALGLNRPATRAPQAPEAPPATLPSPPAAPGLVPDPVPTPGPAPTDAEANANAADTIAIVGISGRFPMARDLDEFWENLLSGRDCVTEIPPDRWDWRAFVDDSAAGPAAGPLGGGARWGAFMDGVDEFDARFFGVSPREALMMDPAQRLMLHHIWKAIEDAGHSAASLSGSRTAIFAATAPTGYCERVARDGAGIESHSSTGAVGSIGPNRASYVLNLHGPSEPIETACSSALVAIHRGIVAMTTGDCDQAIVGGVNLIISPETQVSFDKAGMLSPDGRCKTFSKDANGYARGEGIGFLLLKWRRAAERDGDHIYAIVRGSAENHGGRAKSLTAPNPKAQADLLRAAFQRAGVDPRTLGYIEAHGTGTALGDPIEISALKAAYKDAVPAPDREDRPEPPFEPHCAIGSVKTNIGHLELAAGVAGVMKVLLQLKHRTLVRSLHCDEVNPFLQLDGSPFHLLPENRPWTRLRDARGRELPRRAGVSSFGFGGVNAHIILEEYVPPPAPAAPPADGGPTHLSTAGLSAAGLSTLVVLSARTPDRLKASAQSLLAFLAAGGEGAADDETLDETLARPGLIDRIRDLVGDILMVPAAEIDTALPLDEYGVDPVHRTLLQSRLQEALDLEFAARPFLVNHTVEAIADALLDAHPVLRDRPAPAGAGKATGHTRRRLSLPDLAFTLQVGRDAMDERLAIIAPSLDELAGKLRAFVDGGDDRVPDLFTGSVKQNKGLITAFSADEELREAVGKWIRRGKFARLLDLWVKGLEIDWATLYGDAGPHRITPRRISVPGYPFAPQRFWFREAPAETGALPPGRAAAHTLHPLVHDNRSTFDRTGFGTTLAGTEFYLTDHRVSGRPVLPGVAYLEMARAAAMMALGRDARAAHGVRLTDVTWVRPLFVEAPVQLAIDLDRAAGGTVRYRVSSLSGAVRTVHGQGAVSLPAATVQPRQDIDAIRARPNLRTIPGSACYERFRQAGLGYGPAHQGIRDLLAGDGVVLARLALPATVADTIGDFVLHPSLMDSALQACIGLALAPAGAEDGAPKLALPFAIAEVEVFGACTPSMWAFIRRQDGAVGRVQTLDIDLIDDQGLVRVRIAGFAARLRDGAPPPQRETAEEPGTAGAPAAPMDTGTLRDRTIARLRKMVAAALRLPEEEVDATDGFDSHGIDSMLAMELTKELEALFGPLSKTLFFEHRTLEELAGHFLHAHRETLERLFPPPPAVAQPARKAPAPTVTEAPAAALPSPPDPAAAPGPARPGGAAGPLDIAIIGLSGRYPMARDVEEFWRNLRDGRDCVTEVPPDRWDWRDHSREGRGGSGRHAGKWGGFVPDADKFDALFFNIPPSTAEYLDPQERLFLEHAWAALEDSGYRREGLRQPADGPSGDGDLPDQVGVYAGVMYGEYQLLAHDAVRDGQGHPFANFYASIANRVSYALNLHGPSLAVDTMCSGSLTAIHLACQDLALGRTDMALAGGVNLNLHPNKYAVLSNGQFLSSRGRCESFGAGGDGYVPSEGVGVLVLKRLADAERDGDHIHGVIKGSALNHGGRTNGFSVPNPRAQQAAVSRALRESGVDPRAIGYIEAHGTGTRLGDPIEITGLARALAPSGAPGQSWWIGSAKSNIGHAEAAAGVAAVTKVLLQLREGQIAPSLHAETLNPNIDFDALPFRVNRELRPWPRPVVDGRVARRVAGVSSFGAGGSNAHLLIEEYVPPGGGTASVTVAGATRVLVLSARTEEQLRQAAENLSRHVAERAGAGAEPDQGAWLRNLAFTLQVGREAMQHRLAFTVVTADDLIGALTRFAAGETAGLHVGRVGRHRGAAAQGAAGGEPDAIAAAWVGGAAVDWHALYRHDDAPPARISLPTYPFARERHWLGWRDPARDAAPAAHAAPAADLLMLSPRWDDRPIRPDQTPTAYADHLVFSADPLPEMPGMTVVPLMSGETAFDRRFTDHAATLLDRIREVLSRRLTGPTLVQVVAGLRHEPLPPGLTQALAAMLKTARQENPQLHGQVIDLTGAGTAPTGGELPRLLPELLRSNGRSAADVQIRYRDSRRQVLAWADAPDGGPDGGAPAWRHRGVYLITGGAGGLGLAFAEDIARRAGDPTLILTGRSPLDERRRAALDRLRSLGAEVAYHAVDVADADAVRGLVAAFERSAGRRGRGPLNGVIHSAGILRDSFILRKSAADLRDVFAAKVAGLVNLDHATRPFDLDFLALFASLAGVAGNPGQADYATANAFMDAYAAHRNDLAAGAVPLRPGEIRPRGRTLSIDWPLWRDGGMTLPAQTREMMAQATGLEALDTAAGIAAFHRALAGDEDQVVVLQGDVRRLRGLFPAPSATPAAAEAAPPAPPRPRPAPAPGLRARTQAHVLAVVSEMLKLPVHRIECDVPLEQYGVDSVGFMKLTAELERITGPLPKTLFFEHPSIDAVAAHLAETFAAALTAFFGPDEPPDPPPPEPPPPDAPPPGSRPPDAGRAAAPAPAPATGSGGDIAIVGMSGRFPGAASVEEFWDVLAQGKDCVTEIPPDRWDHARYFDPDRNRPGKSYSKWGGFIDDVGGFDARFFRVPTVEAELLDPQERLFLETVWTLLESAGYLGETLRQGVQSRVGVFVGSMSQQYHAFRSDSVREAVVALSSPGSIANRVSYFFNLQGPSLAIDTMCSSALVALHLACDSLRRGDCRLAIVGGVNVTIHPKKYVALSASQMIGSHPGSTSFAAGDGYLPAEGVGAALLRPLREAIADGDQILGVIKSTAVNHAGQSNGYRVPNGAALADLIAENFTRAGIDPRTVSYVESAANGSPLGDAIELGAQTAGFRRFTADRGFCAIGAVKSNIGHAEAASGMSQLFKVLLQFRHRQLAPTIKTDPPNPDLDFGPTPFTLQRRLEPWRRPVLALDGGPAREQPRRATITAIGLGGTNAHVILEEFAPTDAQPERRPAADHDGRHLLPLSARTGEQLRAMAHRLSAFVGRNPDLPLRDIAHTLQTARETMEHRLAVVADSRAGLVEALEAFLRDGPGAGVAAARVFTGDVNEDNSALKARMSGPDGQSTLRRLVEDGNLDELARCWAKGVRVPWPASHGDRPGRRVALPAYPFTHATHWLPPAETEADAEADPALPPAPAPAPEAGPRPAPAVQAAPPTEESILAFLLERAGRIMGIPAAEVGAGRGFRNLGLDSFAMAALRREFEAAFGVALSARDLLAHPTASALARFAAARLSPGGAPEETGQPPGDGVPAASRALPLSEGQKGLWILHWQAPGSSAYNVPLAFAIDPEIDVALFRRACEHLLLRFPDLTSVFLEEDGDPRRELRPGAPLPFERETIDPFNEPAAIDHLRAKARLPFDLERGPLLRVHVVSSPAGAPAFGPSDVGLPSFGLIVVHHILFDGTSAVLLMTALADACRRLAAGEPLEAELLPATYDDFVTRERQFLDSPRARAQRDYWRGQLGGDLPALRLPTDRPRPARPSRAGAVHQARLPSDLAERLRRTARSLGVTPSVMFLGAFTLLLHRYSGEDDILVVMPAAGRPEPRFDALAGYFVNMIAIRARPSAGQSAADLLTRLQFTLADALDNADYPFPVLVQDLKLARGPSGPQRFQVLFAFQNFGRAGMAAGDDTGHGPFRMIPDIAQDGTHDLALEVYEEAGGFRLNIGYDTDLFDAGTVRRAAGHLLHLLDSLTLQPQADLPRHRLMPAADRLAMVRQGTAPDPSVDSGLGIVELFRLQARATPANIALRYGEDVLDYAGLDRRSDRLTAILRDRGVAVGDRVGVCIGRGFGMVVAFLAVLKAGAVHVPLAPEHPGPRLRFMLGDAGIALVLTDAETRGRVLPDIAGTAPDGLSPDGLSPDWLALDELPLDGPDADGKPAGEQVVPFAPDRPCYIIYTSGSTGQPKGVVVAHRSIAVHAQVKRRLYRLTASDKVLLFASMGFDAALDQLLPGLLSGATVVVRPDELWSPRAFRRHIADLGLTAIDIPPSYLHELLTDTAQDADWDSLRSLRMAVCGGETLTADTVRLWRASPLRGASLFNAYGPTETTVDSLLFEITGATPDDAVAADVPIGRPLPGESVCILDRHGDPVPVGIAGELHIGGAGLALGYLNQPALMRRAFIDHPFKPGERLYRTGDQARWRSDGTVAFLGRLDDQVKIRGFRVECGEVEAALRGLPGVRQAAVVARPVNGVQQLVAFVTGVPADTRPDVRHRLSAMLPDHMIPARTVLLDDMPLTPGGKADRSALRLRPLDDDRGAAAVEPRTPTEARLAGIWKRVLQVGRVGIHDDFFDLGGHSLLAIRLAAIIGKEFGRDLPVASLLAAPDIARQAALLDAGPQQDGHGPSLVLLHPGGGEAPWFWVHPVSGTALCYRDLARTFGGERPIYGLQAPQPPDDQPTNIAALAARHIRAIRSVQRQGPYHLAGWSLGGVIAFEMARQLAEAGEETASLALVDSYTPAAARAAEDAERRRLDIPDDDGDAALLLAFGWELGLAEADLTEAVLTGPRDLPARLDRLLDHAAATGRLEDGHTDTGPDRTEMRRLFGAVKANVEAMNRHVPQPLRLARAALFKAVGAAGVVDGAVDGIVDPWRHGEWATLIGEGLRVVAAPGTHHSLLRPPDVQTLVNKLKDFLDDHPH